TAIGAGETARALRGASDAAYRAVRRAVEGRMLSVIRELAEEAEARAPQEPPLESLLVELVRRGEDAVARTPEQLQVLRDAGVVDAGGAGLLELVRGIASAVTGQPLPEAPQAEEHLAVDAIHQELSQYRYCTVFLIEGGHALGAADAVILPNNGNVLLAAEHAAAHADRPVEVVAAGSIPAGLAAMVAFDGSRGAAANAAEMREAADAVATGEVTIA